MIIAAISHGLHYRDLVKLKRLHDVALAVKAFMLSRPHRLWEGPHGRFKEELEAYRFGEDKHRPKGWPPTVNVMSIRLRQAATSLRRARIEV